MKNEMVGKISYTLSYTIVGNMKRKPKKKNQIRFKTESGKTLFNKRPYINFFLFFFKTVANL